MSSLGDTVLSGALLRRFREQFEKVSLVDIYTSERVWFEVERPLRHLLVSRAVKNKSYKYFETDK